MVLNWERGHEGCLVDGSRAGCGEGDGESITARSRISR